MFWVATRYFMTQSVINAMNITRLINFGHRVPSHRERPGQRGQQWSLDLMLDTFNTLESSLRVVIVQYQP